MILIFLGLLVFEDFDFDLNFALVGEREREREREIMTMRSILRIVAVCLGT